MRTTDFDFFLPEHLIAQFPTAERSASRLLKLDSSDKKPQDCLFKQLPDFFRPDDLLIFNDTRVIKARLSGQKSTGGMVEVFIERVLTEHSALALIRASKAPKIGAVITLANAFDVSVISRQDDLFLLQLHIDTPILELLERYGTLPLPPYITHTPDEHDDERYQTVYARTLGAVAAPTAGLHFDESMIDNLKAMGVHIAYITLHVGAGTFQPVRVDNISEHKMHSERYTVPEATVSLIRQARANGRKITAVGTTALRALESAARTGELLAGGGDTDIFITPGYQFKVVDRLLTNFHLPKSTLLMLVSAFAGVEPIKLAYRHAVQQQYRFFSYGDAMLLEKAH